MYPLCSVSVGVALVADRRNRAATTLANPLNRARNSNAELIVWHSFALMVGAAHIRFTGEWLKEDILPVTPIDATNYFSVLSHREVPVIHQAAVTKNAFDEAEPASASFIPG